MLKRAIVFLLSGVLLPYVGMWFAQSYLLGNGPEPNFLPMQIASLFALLLSVGLYCLSKIEENNFIKAICIFVALGYALTGIAYVLFGNNSEYSWLLYSTSFFFKNFIAALVALLIFRNCRVIHDET